MSKNTVFIGTVRLRANVIGSGFVGVGMTLDLDLNALPHTLS